MIGKIDEPTQSLPRGWHWQLAYWVSEIISPPVVGGLAVILCALVAWGRETWWWVLIYVSVTIAIPTSYVVVQVQRGVFSDFHLERREERIRPLLLSLACGLLAWLLLWKWNSPRPFLLLAGINALQTLLFFLFTLRWKVSMHAAAISGLSLLALNFLGSAALALTVFVPLVAWSRVHLKRHTVGQTIGGIMLGSSAVMALLILY